MQKPIINRIYEKIVCDIKTQCWNWTGSLIHNGYGNIKFNGKTQSVHRIVYEKLCGLISKDKPFVLHKCDNRKCCNPKHLYTGTFQDNANDRIKRNPNSWLNGEKHGSSKLTERQVLKIRESNDTQVVLAKRFKVSQMTISNIKNRKRWKHI